MLCRTVCCLMAMLAVNHGGGVTKPSGLSQFWTDDYKVFDQIYGRTSDKELYEVSLPPSISYGVEATNIQRNDAKSIKYNHKTKEEEEDEIVSSSQIDAYGLDDNYAQLRQRVKYVKDLIEPIKANKIIYKTPKFISEDTDPEAYSYLKHLEQFSKQDVADFPQHSLGTFKSYGGPFKLGNSAPETYKSIQDILEAQDDKPKQKSKLEEEDVINFKYNSGQSNRNKKHNTRGVQNNRNNSSRCGGKGYGRCRKRSNSYGRYRTRTRPFIKTIKHTIVSE